MVNQHGIEDFIKNDKKGVVCIYCMTCGKSFQLSEEDKERIKFGIKFVIVCPFCGSDDISVRTSGVV